MKKCLRCGSDIPTWVNIDGKPRNLSKRRFCLQCSPFGKHNTRDLRLEINQGGEKECKVCHRVLDEREFYQRSNRRGGTYSTCKKCFNEISQQRKQKIKVTLVERCGGKCCICGYSQCVAALEFHHIDPDKKDVPISLINGKSVEKIMPELEQCVMVCANCHREIHAGLVDVLGLSSCGAPGGS